MTNNKLERKISQAFAHATPDVLDRVLSNCQTEERKVISMTQTTRKNHWIKFVAGAAAALVLLAGGAFGIRNYQLNTRVDSTISLDVNPSVEIKTNRNQRVLDVTANNEDGKKIIGEMDFAGSDLDVTINALIGSMLRNGYISEIANSILVSVENEDTAKAAALQQQLSDEIAALLQGDAFAGSVISQTVTTNDALTTLAKTHNISVGKAKLIQQLIALNSAYTFDALAPLSINELNLLKARYDTASQPTITATGSASDKAYIGADKAKQIAFDHAKVNQSDVRDLEVELDFDDGIMLYEVDFQTGRVEYNYDIKAADGSVIRVEKDQDNIIDDVIDDIDDRYDDDRPVSSAQAASGDIGRDQAKQIAFDHAGCTADQVRNLSVEFDRDDGVASYEIEFQANGYEFEYDIKADDGSILKSEKDRDD